MRPIWIESSHIACRALIQIVIKNARLDRFHQLFPLPITVETQFQLIKDNKLNAFLSKIGRKADFNCATQ